MPTYNSGKYLSDCLESIDRQDYPRELVEIIIADENSTDQTREIARRHRARIVESAFKSGESAKAVALLEAKNDLVAMIDSDNVLPNANWFREMVQPFLDHPEVVASQTWRYGLRPNFNVSNRYCALIGANDPVVFYLGKCEKVSWLSDEWHTTPILEDRGAYFLVNFTENNLPTVGGNGFVIRRDVLSKSRCGPEDFFHIDVIADLLKMGFNPFAMVRNEIYHNTASSIGELSSRRKKYFLIHNPLYSNRRYLIFDFKKRADVLKLVIFSLKTLSVLPLFVVSVKGYLRKKDSAWFLHPYACWSFFLSYSTATLMIYFRLTRQHVFDKIKSYVAV